MFQNLSIDPKALPQAAEADFHGLEPKYRVIRLLGSLIFFVVVLALLTAGTWFTPDHWWKTVAWITLPTMVLAGIIYRWFSFPYMRYALREHDIIFELGWWWKASTAVPFSRIQHAEVDQGFFERMYGLATINVFTAGGSSSDLAIPGLSQQDAHTLRDFILGRVDSTGTQAEADSPAAISEKDAGTFINPNTDDDAEAPTFPTSNSEH